MHSRLKIALLIGAGNILWIGGSLLHVFGIVDRPTAFIMIIYGFFLSMLGIAEIAFP